MLRKAIIVCMLFFAGIAQGMGHEKYGHKYYKNNFGFSDFRLEVAKCRLREYDSFYFTCHALKQMERRQVSRKNVSRVIRHGNRYCIPGFFKPRQMVVDTQTEIGVVIVENKTVITVLINMNQAAVDLKLSRWNKEKKAKFAIKEDV